MTTQTFKYALLLGAILMCFPAWAQDYIMHDDFDPTRARRGTFIHVKGHVQMKETESQKIVPLEQAAVRVFCLTDSAYNGGTVTNKEGNFWLPVFQERKKAYELQISYIGTDTYKLKLATGKGDIKCDTVTLKEKPITMEEAVIVAKLKKMRILGDTTIFNPEAFHLSENSILLELVRRMPGLKLDNGKMTYQGKDISEILVNGEKFFAKNIAIALQNMPVNVLKEVRIYDKQSDKTKITGVDDGERTTVMDLKTKNEIDNALMGNVSAGGGDHHLYGLRGMVNQFKKGGDHITVMGNRRTTPNDIGMVGYSMGGGGFAGGGDFAGGGGNPMRMLNQTYGASMAQGIKPFNVDGSVDYSENSSDTKNYTISENYLPTGNTFVDESGTSGSGSRSLGGNFSILGDFGERNHLLINASFNRNKSHNVNENMQASYNRNPHDYTNTPLTQEDLVPADSRINRIDRSSLSHNLNNSFNGSVGYIHTFEKERRNFQMQFNTGLSNARTENFQRSTTRYYQLGDSVLYQNRFTLSPSNTQSYNIRTSFNEPLSKNVNLELHYEYQHSRNHQDESIYDLERVSDSSLPLGKLPSQYEGARIDSLSNVNNTTEQAHIIGMQSDIDLGNAWRLNIEFSVDFNKQRVYMLRDQMVTDTTLNSIGFNPSIGLFYFKDRTSLTVNYNGASNQPGVNYLLPVVNNDNPLYVTKGNTHLKNSFRHGLNMNYRNNKVWVNSAFNQTFNEVAYKTVYNPVTGVRTNSPENINGNWNISTMVGFSKDWDFFAIESTSGYNFSHQVSFVTSNADSHKNTVKNHNVSQMLKASYTPDWGEFILSGDMSLNRTKDNLQTGSTSFTKTYSMRAEATGYLPWNIQVSTNFQCIFRRGFLSRDMNKTEPLWNASASWSFLKKKQASLRIEVYDILQRATNLYASVNENGSVQMRSEGINSYALLSFSYRFNLFKGKKSEEKE